jgi:hypothetical protein
MERAKDTLFITGVSIVQLATTEDVVHCMTNRSAGQSVRRRTLANKLFHGLRLANQGSFCMSCQGERYLFSSCGFCPEGQLASPVI